MHSVSIFFYLFYFGRHTYGIRLQALFRTGTPTTPQFFKSVSSRRKQDRKKVIRLTHHIHSTHEHQAHGLCMLRLTQMYTNWYAQQQQQQQQFYFFFSPSQLTHNRQSKDISPVLF